MFQSDSVAFTCIGDGIFIPPANLGGFIAAEMATGEPLSERLSKFYYALGKQFATFRQNNPDLVGVNVSRSESVVDDRFGVKLKNFTFTFQQVIDDREKVEVFPPPATTGIRSGLADFAFINVFPNAVKVSAGTQTSGAGVLILSSAIAAESPLTHATIDLSADSRELTRAILAAMFTNRPLRTAETASAVTAASYSTNSSPAIPSSWTQALNPFTAIPLEDARYFKICQRSVSYTIETIDDEDSQTFDVNTIVTP